MAYQNPHNTRLSWASPPEPSHRQQHDALAFARWDVQRRIASHRSHFDPNQPRVPAGHPDGGQWTSWGNGHGNRAYAAAGSAYLPIGQVMTDALPDPISVWSQYAQADGGRDVQDPAIELTRQVLHDVLAKVNALVSVRQDLLSAQLYGIAVHKAFADVVRALNLPGIGTVGVEQSFDAEGLARYGLDGSIRTDIVLRNAQRDIIAIYDVKTGNATMSSTREAKIRAFTKAGRDVPVIILRAVRRPAAR
jgi:hypothetical protein